MELDPITVRVVGDGSRFKRTLKEAEHDSRRTKKVVEEDSKKSEHGVHRMHLSHRGLHRGIHSIVHLGHVKNVEQGMQSVGHLGMAIGHQFGMGGMLAAGGLMLIFAAATKIKELMEDKVQKAAGEAFGAVIDGSKNASQALADVRFTAIKKEFKELTEMLGQFGGPSVRAQMMRNLLAAEGGAGELFRGMLEHDIDEAVHKAEEIQARLRQLMDMPAARRLQSIAAVAKVEVDTADLEKENELKMSTLGLAESQVKVERQRLEVMRQFRPENTIAQNAPLYAMLERLERLRLSALATDTAELVHEWERAGEIAGMTAEEVKIYDLAVRGADEATLDYLEVLRQWNEVSKEGEDVLRKLTKENENFGMSAAEAAAQNAEAMGQFDLAERLRSADAVHSMHEQLKKDWSELEGLIKSTMTPLEKFQDEMSHLDELRGIALLTDDWDALEAVQRREQALLGDMNRPAEKFQAALFGSAESMGRMAEFQERLRLTGPTAAGAASAGGFVGPEPAVPVTGGLDFADPGNARVVGMLGVIAGFLEVIADNSEAEQGEESLNLGSP